MVPLWLMGAYTKVFGRSPRIKVVEAILRLAPGTFTRPEVAREAGVHKPSANRALSALERDGIIERASEGPIRYRTRDSTRTFEVLALTEAALRLARRKGIKPKDKAGLIDLLRVRLREQSPAFTRRIVTAFTPPDAGPREVVLAAGGGSYKALTLPVHSANDFELTSTP